MNVQAASKLLQLSYLQETYSVTTVNLIGTVCSMSVACKAELEVYSVLGLGSQKGCKSGYEAR